MSGPTTLAFTFLNVSRSVSHPASSYFQVKGMVLSHVKLPVSDRWNRPKPLWPRLVQICLGNIWVETVESDCVRTPHHWLYAPSWCKSEFFGCKWQEPSSDQLKLRRRFICLFNWKVQVEITLVWSMCSNDVVRNPVSLYFPKPLSFFKLFFKFLALFSVGINPFIHSSDNLLVAYFALAMF